MKIENFDGNHKEDKDKYDFSSGDEYQEQSSATKQFNCLKSKRNKKQLLYDADQIQKDMDKGGSMFRSSESEKNENFSPLSVVWIILPIMNLCTDIAMDFAGVIMFFVKEIFNMTYKMIVPSMTSFLGEAHGMRIGKKYCFNYSWFRYVILALCPPAGVFMAYGFKGWLQILLCCVATLFYYFPGLAYALIVINRSEVSSYMKTKMEPSSCKDDSGLLGNFYISDQNNKPTCARDVGESCSLDPKPLGSDPSKLDCCAVPELINGQWMRLGKIATDYNGNPINRYSQGEVICRNDTKKIKLKKGLCVWKATMKPN